jgi:hypothetical protein
MHDTVDDFQTGGKAGKKIAESSKPIGGLAI